MNPLVTLSFWLRREMASKACLVYIIAQFAGAVCGTLLAHGLFELAAVSTQGGQDRDSTGEVFGEAVSVFMLLTILFGCLATGAQHDIPLGTTHGPRLPTLFAKQPRRPFPPAEGGNTSPSAW